MSKTVYIHVMERSDGTEIRHEYEDEATARRLARNNRNLGFYSWVEVREKEELPKLLDRHLEVTGQYAEAQRFGIVLSRGHLLAEAQECLRASYHGTSTREERDELWAFVDGLLHDGVVPTADFTC